jgi:hypothetical protein
VGADVLVFAGRIGVDQSALTGESALVQLAADGSTPRPLAFAGSLIKTGEATGLVVGTGVHTLFGETVSLVSTSSPSRHSDRIMRQVTFFTALPVCLLVVAAIVVLAVTGAEDANSAVPLLLMLLVSALPVALPAMYTVAQALGSAELVKAGVLVARQSCIEDAASMNVLFSDKTGTMTLNVLTVGQVRALAPVLAWPKAACREDRPAARPPARLRCLPTAARVCRWCHCPTTTAQTKLAARPTRPFRRWQRCPRSCTTRRCAAWRRTRTPSTWPFCATRRPRCTRTAWPRTRFSECPWTHTRTRTTSKSSRLLAPLSRGGCPAERALGACPSCLARRTATRWRATPSPTSR